MTTLGLIAKPLADAEVVNRRQPPVSLLRRACVALLEVAEAMLRPTEVER